MALQDHFKAVRIDGKLYVGRDGKYIHVHPKADGTFETDIQHLSGEEEDELERQAHEKGML